MSEKNIRELALEAAQGSAPAFQDLYRLTRQRAWFVALSITRNEHDAQDILQESYLTAFENIGQLTRPESFVPWLNKIVANKAKNYIGRKKPDSFAEYGDENAQDWQEETDPEFIPDEHLDQAEAKALIASLVEELPEDQRLVVLLRYYDDMEVASIAKSLEIPEGTVKSRLGRARRKLAAMLAQARGKGLNLYAMAPIPLLAYFIKLLGFDAPGSDRLPPLLIGSAAAGTAAAGGAAAAGASASKNAALAGKSGGQAGKVAAIAAAVAVAVGGFTAAGVYAYHKASPPAVVTAAPATETGGDAYTQTQAAPDQFPTLLIPEPGQTTQAPPVTQAPPPATQAPPSRADNPNAAAGARESTQPPAPAEPAKATATSRSTSSTAKTTRGTASTTRAPWSFPSFAPYSRTTTTTATTAATTTTTSTTSTTTTTTVPTTTTTTTTATTTTTVPTTTTTTTTPTTTTTTTTTEPPTTTTEPTTVTEPAKPDFEYARDAAGGYVITKYNGGQADVVVPAEIDGVAISHMGVGAFAGTNVARVTISPGIDCLRDNTFADCPDLEEVIVPDTVVNVMGSPFTGSPKVVIVCGKDSRAHKYAQANGIGFRLV
ncbi:MAG: sigma-70 family RNA polymerase sigma factor [Oscillospiraceae bacterium]|jgi:RNA polymerase sigma factor (sigma-70 family)|nr:sigma-70 family RNA polymerase sigma factor [Oscillospiraceae bacterium]